MLVVHLAFTTANSIHLCTTDYLLSLSDTDTISEHLPIADIANRESIRMWEGQLSSLIHIALHVCTPNKLYPFSFNISTSQCSTTSLSPHLFGCLVRDLNYGPWPVTVCLCPSLSDHSSIRLSRHSSIVSLGLEAEG